jgi:NitT/TauT family transport system substrate-binding protein
MLAMTSVRLLGKPRKRLGVAAGALALVLASAACGGSGATSTGLSDSATIGPLEKTHLTVGALAVSDDAPLYLAIKEGLFKQAGLTVTTRAVPASTQAIPDMVRGTVDVMAGANYVSFFQAQDKGEVSLKILADASHCTQSTFQIMALPGSGIAGPADLAGKRIAVNLLGNVQTLTLDSVLQANGVKLSSVHYVQIPFADMANALAEHRVDAISALEPYITTSEEDDGATPVVSQCTGPTSSFPMSGYFVTAAWAAKYPNTAKAFQRVIDEAQSLAGGSQQAIREILPTYTGISAETADVMSMGTYPDTLSVAALEQVADTMRTAGMLPRPLSVQALMTGP